MRLASFALAFCLLLGVPVLAAPGDTLVVIGDGVNVRFRPSTDAHIGMQVYRNQRVTELQREGDWVRVEIAGGGGQEGWIHGSLLAPAGGVRLAEPVPPAAPTMAPAGKPPTPAGKPAAPGEVAAGQPPPAETPPAAVSGVEVPAPKPTAEPPAQMTEAPTQMTEAPAPASTPAPSSGVAAATPTTMPAEPAPQPSTAEPATQPSTIEPAAPAPAADETIGLERFRESVDYLNSRAVSVAGVDLFAGVEPLGDGAVQVAATDAWSTIPPAGQESYANTLLDRWAAARGRTGPVNLRIVDSKGKVIMEKSRP